VTDIGLSSAHREDALLRLGAAISGIYALITRKPDPDVTITSMLLCLHLTYSKDVHLYHHTQALLKNC
jgi:hypothetical protein